MKKKRVVASVLIVFSLFAGIFVFLLNSYRCSTLSLEATSMEHGFGTVYFEGAGFRGSSSRNFEINEFPDDRGAKKLYVIELPAVMLKTLRITPHIQKGNWGVDRIILANDVISYTWDAQGACSQLTRDGAVHKKETCPDGTPALTASNDATITISEIPATGFTNTFGARITMAVAAAFAIFLGGTWLLRPCSEESRAGLLQHYGVKAAWLTVATLFLYQLYLVARYSVDIPTLDEWIVYFKPDGLINGLTWEWLFGFHNEHQIVITKLMAWLNLKLFGLNFTLQTIGNYFIFGGLLASVAVLKNRILGSGQFELFPWFMIFMLSPINFENHLWAFQSQFHLVLLFFVLMQYHAYRSELTVKAALAFSLYAVLAMYSLSAGVIFVVIYLLCLAVYVGAGIIGNRINRTAGWRFLLTVCGICGVSLIIWFSRYIMVAEPTPMVFPNDFRFWGFFLNIVSFGFGFNSMHILPGIVCLALAALPPALLLMNKDTRWQPATWHVLSAVLGILVLLAATSMGRSWGYMPKTSRYVEISFLLIPYTAVGWWLVIRESTRRAAVLLVLWLFCFAAYFDNWSTKEYALFRQFSLYNLQYAEDCYSGARDYICPEDSTQEDIVMAKRHAVSFTRRFLSTIDEEK